MDENRPKLKPSPKDHFHHPTSDRIRPLDKEDILDKIADIPVSCFDFKPSHCADGENCKNRMGLIAEDFHTIFQRGSEKEIKGQEVQMALWMAVRHLYARNKELSQNVENLVKTSASR